MVFHARKLTLWLMLVACLLFAALGYISRPGLPVQGTLLCVLMLVFAGMAALALYQGRPTLQLNAQGLVQQAVWNTVSVRWSQIESIDTIYIRGNPLLAIRYRAVLPGKHGATRSKTCTLSNVYDAPLPGIQATLQAWQRMYGSTR